VWVVDPMGNHRLLAHSNNVRAHEVQVQTGGKPNGDDRQEPRHDLHDHLLLGVDRSIGIAAPCYLALLDIARHPDQHDQQQEGERGGEGISKGIGEAGRQIHPQKVHLCVFFERHPQFRISCQILGIESPLSKVRRRGNPAITGQYAPTCVCS